MNMNTTKYIFGKPDFVEGAGLIYPIKLKDYDDFVECSTVLYFSKNHFLEEVRDKFSLLELLIYGLREDNVVDNLEKTFSLAFQDEVVFFYKEMGNFGFKLKNNNGIVDKHNYDTIRSIIMRQNLMFEPKVFKDKIVQQWANKVLQAKAKNSIKMELEDMISTVSVYTGKHYWDLAEYTIYQLKCDFNRITKFKNFDAGIIANSFGGDVKVEHFAENIDLFKDPYSLDNFTKSKDKMNKIEKAINS